MKKAGLCLAVTLAAVWSIRADATRPASAPTVPAACPNTVSPIVVPLATTIGHIVVDPGCQYVYLTNTAQNQFEIYSLQTLSFEAPIQVGPQPFGFDVSDDGMFAYVANSGGDTISVIDLQDRVVTSTLVVPIAGSPLSQFSPFSVAIANNGKILFTTSNGGTGGLRELNLANSQITVRADYEALAGVTTLRMHLRASRDRSTIAIASGNSSAGPVVVYLAASDSFGPRKRLDHFISDVSLDETGQTIMVTPGSYVVEPSPSLAGTIIGVPLNVIAAGSAIDPTRGVGYRSLLSRLDVLNMSTFLKIGELPLGASVSATLSNRIGRMDISDDGTLVAVITNTGFSLVRPLLTAPQNLNLVQNGGFSSGMGNWQTFATPDPSYVQSEVTDGVLQFNRLAPPITMF
jgi:DNA-binding beta-propeller fold protein YncE